MSTKEIKLGDLLVKCFLQPETYGPLITKRLFPKLWESVFSKVDSSNLVYYKIVGPTPDGKSLILQSCDCSTDDEIVETAKSLTVSEEFLTSVVLLSDEDLAKFVELIYEEILEAVTEGI